VQAAIAHDASGKLVEPVAQLRRKDETFALETETILWQGNHPAGGFCAVPIG